MKDVIIYFVKEPKSGLVKTRLYPSLTRHQAAEIYKCLVRINLQTTVENSLWDVVISYRGRRTTIQKAFGKNPRYVNQGMGDLGVRMENAFKKVRLFQGQKIILMGSDQLGVTKQLIKDAFKRLDRYDVVLGPAWDGGFYLMGIRKSLPESFFSRISWSSDKTLSECLKKFGPYHLSVTLLKSLGDVDTYEDLAFHYWKMNNKKKNLAWIHQLDQILSRRAYTTSDP